MNKLEFDSTVDEKNVFFLCQGHMLTAFDLYCILMKQGEADPIMSSYVYGSV